MTSQGGVVNKTLQIKTREELSLSSLKRGQIHHIQLHIPGSSMGTPWRVPLIVARGIHKGPVLGITAAVHGNELNGLSTIFQLFKKMDPSQLAGTLIAVPISNVPGYIAGQRYFPDGQDLNRRMPGKLNAKMPSDVYNYFFTSKIIKHFNYLLDLHTASVGKINSLYIRADLEDPVCSQLAYWQNPHIIVQKYDENGTLRAWANSQKIPSVTVEIGNPNTFQQDLIDDCLDGIINTLAGLKMINKEVRDYTGNSHICSSSHWIYSPDGGILDVPAKLAENVKKDQIIANIYDVFGSLKSVVKADTDGVVIGKTISPNCIAGSRIVHLGVT